jgi:hypothetical protein
MPVQQYSIPSQSSTPYYLFMIVIVIVKVSFLLVALYYNWLKRSEPKNVEKQTLFFTLKEQIDFVYVILMSILILINFNPWTPMYIDMETKTLLFIYGIITLFTAKYSTFRNQSLITQLNAEQNDGLEMLIKPENNNNNNNNNHSSSSSSFSGEYLIS